jgi:hypothetical protein
MWTGRRNPNRRAPRRGHNLGLEAEVFALD